ncbi:MAG: hypothetical protein JWP95_1660, partial [Actinotalea sp.]|nr:hypothetical protein [Actinotalea sp.]
PHPPVPPPASATAAVPVAAPGATSVQGEQSATRRGHAADRPLDEVEQPRVVDQHVREVEERELPERPKKPGFGRHLLGALLGLLLTPVALLLTGIGTARLADVAGSGDPLTDALGLTLLVVGVLLLAVIVLLGAWSPAVPIVGGLVWGIGLGLAFLVVPEVMADTLEQMSADNVVPGGIEQLAESAQSGYLLVTGTLLVAAGIAAARARRRGRRFAEGVAAHDAAQVQVREGRRVA